jgi:hypothetical protein
MAPRKPSSDTILEAYRQLCEFVRHEEDLLWKRMEIFLILNSALVALVGLGATTNNGTFFSAPRLSNFLSPIGMLLSLLGAMLNFSWLLIIRRSHVFHNLWVLQLIVLEKEYLAPLRIFQKAYEYLAKGSTSLGDKQLRLSSLFRFGKYYTILMIIPTSLTVFWIILIVYFIVVIV